MNKYFGVFLLLFLLTQGISQSISLEWVTQINGDRSAITGSFIRENGDILIRGFYQEYLAVDADTIIGDSDERQDSYLIELDSNGGYNWSERFDYTTGEVYDEIASYNNQIYNQGRLTWSTTTFRGVNFDSLNVGQNDKVYATPGFDLKIDEEGNLYVTGSFRDSLDFDPGPNKTMLYALNSIDAYVAKYDSKRNLKWARSFPGLASEGGKVVASDINQNVYMAANFGDSIDIDLEIEGFELPNDINQNNSYYLTKLSSNGTLEWYKPLNGVGSNTIKSIAIDNENENEITIVGGFRQEFIYEIGGVRDTLFSKGEEDVYVARLDSMGNFIWINHLGGEENEFGLFVIINKGGYIFVAGSFYDSLTFNPDIDSTTISNGFSDSFIQIYNKEGNYISHYTYGGIGFDWIRSIHFDEDDNLILVSSAGGEIDVDLGVEDFLISPFGLWSSFVAKYSYCLPSSSVDFYTICEGEELLVNGTSYNTEGVYYQTLQNENQCDSTLTIDLTVYESYKDTIITSICEGDTLLGYTDEGDYEIIYTSQEGCDSIIFLNLSFLPDSDPSCLTSVSKDIKRISRTKLYPIPVRDICFIKSANPIEKLLILNSAGMIISIFNKIVENQIDISHLPNGVYLFHIIDKYGMQTLRTIKI